MRFEWDENKNTLNQMKHGISFEKAKEVFYDPKCIELYDTEHSLFEKRWLAYGFSGCKVLTVVFTYRKGIIRIISARKAKKNEEKEYLRWL